MTCAVRDCTRIVFRRDHCKYHYAKKLDNGELPRLRRTPAESREEYLKRKREHAAAHAAKYPEAIRRRMLRWRLAHRDYEAEKARARNRSIRLEVIEALGGSCAMRHPGICGGSFEPCLDVDHINGGGGSEVRLRKRHSSCQIAHEDLLKHGRDFVRTKYQLLCCNCHRVKTRGLAKGSIHAVA